MLDYVERQNIIIIAGQALCMIDALAAPNNYYSIWGHTKIIDPI